MILTNPYRAYGYLIVSELQMSTTSLSLVTIALPIATIDLVGDNREIEV